MYVICDIRTNKYKYKRRGEVITLWTSDIQKAQLFKTKGAAKRSLYDFSINPNKRRGAKIILPTWVNIIELEPVTIKEI